MSAYFVGQGIVYAAKRVGSAQGFFPLGNCPQLELTLGTAMLADALGGSEDQPLATPSGERPSLTMVLEDLNIDNLALMLYGNKTVKTGASVTDTLVAFKGRSVPLSAINLTAWTHLKNNSGTVTYTQGSDYTVNLVAGTLFIPTTSTITEAQTIKATYTHGGYSTLATFTTAPPFYWLRFEGLNTAASDSPVVVDVFKTRISPPDMMPLIGDTVTALTLKGSIFYDEDRAADSLSGAYFRVRML